MPRALRQRLKILLEHAEQKPGCRVKIHLKNNLQVEIVYTTEITHLVISRGCYMPTLADWKSVLQNWPYPLQAELEIKRRRRIIILYASFLSCERGRMTGRWSTKYVDSEMGREGDGETAHEERELGDGVTGWKNRPRKDPKIR